MGGCKKFDAQPKIREIIGKFREEKTRVSRIWKIFQKFLRVKKLLLKRRK
jgi:hypothetical protein